MNNNEGRSKALSPRFRRQKQRLNAIRIAAAFGLLALAFGVRLRSGATPRVPRQPTFQAHTPDRPEAQASGLRLSARDKELLAEVIRLKHELGDEVWPGLGLAPIPVIIYNDGYEFLTGADTPPPSPPWVKVDGDDFAGQPYYRRPAHDPQAFAVDVDGRWAGSMTSLDAILARKVSFKPRPDFYLVLVLHEVFHAFQAIKQPERFRRAMALYSIEKDYPAKDPAFAKAWTEEGALLASALRAKDEQGLLDGVRAFLRHRESRRRPWAEANRPSSKDVPGPIDLAEYERGMEWLEGLGKYAEMRFYELAAARSSEPAFAAYNPSLPYWTWDYVRLEKQMGAQKGDLRFYLSGMAQARLLDRLSPGWKAAFFEGGRAMDELLAKLAAAGD